MRERRTQKKQEENREGRDTHEAEKERKRVEGRNESKKSLSQGSDLSFERER